VNTYGDLTIPEIQDFRSYLPNAFDDNLTLLQKVNMVIQTLTSMGVSVNSLFENWNNVIVPYVTGDGLNTDVVNQLTSWKNDGTLESLINTSVSEKLKDMFVNVKVDFNAKGDGLTNDTNAIVNALNSLKNTGGTLFFPLGTYLIDSIDLTLFKNIIIKGCNSTIPYNYIEQSVIKINSSVSIGIKCSTTEENPTSYGEGITFENIELNGNFLSQTVINMNRNVELHNVLVQNSLGDGVVLEGTSYPIILNRVVSKNNKGHGVHVKAPNTTIYNMYDCEFSNNDLYGLYIEDGSTAYMQNIQLQNNKQGGLRIILQNSTLFTLPIYLERLSFVNVYCENNGLYDTNNQLFDGNYALKITGQNTDPSVVTGKINDLYFRGCSFNKSSVGDYVNVTGTNNLVSVSNSFLIQNIDETKNRRSFTNYGTQTFTDEIITNGQIKFPITPNPSTDATTLDDFKQFNANLSIGQNNAGNFTTTLNTNFYIKIGKLVILSFNIAWSDIGTTSSSYNLTLKNLPYNVRSGGLISPSFVELITTPSNTDRWSCVPMSGTSNAQFRKNMNTSYATIADIPSSGQINATLMYFTD
jgi:hypothetical protein